MEPYLAAQARLVPCVRSTFRLCARPARQSARTAPRSGHLACTRRQYSQKLHNDASLSTKDAIQEVSTLTTTALPPSSSAIVQCLQRCKSVAESLRNATVEKEKVRQLPQRGDTASPSLSLLEETRSQSPAPTGVDAEELSEALYDLVEAPQIFISPEVLSLYIDLQSKLGRPETFPKVLGMFADKPIPIKGSSPMQVKQQNPRSVNAAIPPDVAHKALDAAIDAKILPLCLDIVEKTVRQPAYRRRRLVTRAWPLAAGIVLTPPFAYALARKFNDWQITLTESYATWGAFVGICSYVYFTGGIGYVALTTSNDQMERVTWQDGIPLWERWMGEDERAMMDKVALSWGFKEKHRRGEEEGPEWEALKELISMRDMILDRVNLMEGME